MTKLEWQEWVNEANEFAGFIVGIILWTIFIVLFSLPVFLLINMVTNLIRLGIQQ